MAPRFKAHKGRHPRAEFEAHKSAVHKRVFSAHARALPVKKPKAVKVKKPKKPKKMNMTKYRTALKKQVTAALEARQGL
jgi:hypothetical protein